MDAESRAAKDPIESTRYASALLATVEEPKGGVDRETPALREE